LGFNELKQKESNHVGSPRNRNNFILKKGFDHAVKKGVKRATKTLRNVQSAWVKDQNVMVKDGEVVEYRVVLKITFILGD